MLAKRISATVATQFAVLFMGIFTSVVINRMLQPEGRGLLTTYTTAIHLIATMGSLGLTKGYTYSISHSKGDSTVIKNAVTAALLNGLLLGILTIPLAQVHLGGLFDQLPDGVVALSIFATISFSLMGAGNEIVRGMNRIREFNIGSIIYQGLYLILNLIVATTIGLQLDRVVVIFILCQWITSFYYFFIIYRDAPGLNFTWRVMREFITYGFKYLLYTLLSALHNRVDVLIIGSLLTSRDVGQYSTGVNLAQLLWNLPFAINIILFPYIAERESNDDVSIQTARITRATTMLLIIIAIPFAILAPFIIQLLYGSEYLPAVEPLRWLLPGIIAFGIVRVAGAHLLGRNQLMAITALTGFAMILNVILNLSLIPILGINGAALASSVTYILNAFGAAWLVSREGHVTVIDILMPRLLDLQSMRKSASKLVK